MFEKLTERLGDVFGRLTRRGALTEADVDAALREVRVALRRIMRAGERRGRLKSRCRRSRR